jgi:hypothetical protein
MQESNEIRIHSKRIDNVRDSLHRSGSSFTVEDAGTVVGICVSLLIVLAGALAYIVCFSLPIALARDCVRHIP